MAGTMNTSALVEGRAGLVSMESGLDGRNNGYQDLGCHEQ